MLEVVLASVMLAMVSATIATAVAQINRAERLRHQRLAAYEVANRVLLQHMDDAEELARQPAVTRQHGWLFRFSVEEEPVEIEALDGLDRSALPTDATEIARAAARGQERGEIRDMLRKHLKLLRVRVYRAEQAGGGAAIGREQLAEMTRLYNPLLMLFRNDDTRERAMQQDRLLRLLQQLDPNAGLAPAPGTTRPAPAPPPRRGGSSPRGNPRRAGSRTIARAAARTPARSASRPRRAGGFTLLELTLAATLGSVVVLAALGLFTVLRTSDTRSERRLREQIEIQRLHATLQRSFRLLVLEPQAAPQAARPGATPAENLAAAERRAAEEAERTTPPRILLTSAGGGGGVGGGVGGGDDAQQRLELVLAQSPVPVTDRFGRSRFVLPDAEGGGVRGALVLGGDPEAGGGPGGGGGGGRALGGQSVLWQQYPFAEGPDLADRAVTGTAVVARGVRALRYTFYKTETDEQTGAKELKPRRQFVAHARKDMPAYVEVEVVMNSGESNIWLFEVGWMVTPEPEPEARAAGLSNPTPQPPPDQGSGSATRRRPTPAAPTTPPNPDRRDPRVIRPRRRRGEGPSRVAVDVAPRGRGGRAGRGFVLPLVALLGFTAATLIALLVERQGLSRLTTQRQVDGYLGHHEQAGLRDIVEFWLRFQQAALSRVQGGETAGFVIRAPGGVGLGDVTIRVEVRDGQGTILSAGEDGAAGTDAVLQRAAAIVGLYGPGFTRSRGPGTVSLNAAPREVIEALLLAEDPEAPAPALGALVAQARGEGPIDKARLTALLREAGVADETVTRLLARFTVEPVLLEVTATVSDPRDRRVLRQSGRTTLGSGVHKGLILSATKAGANADPWAFLTWTRQTQLDDTP